MAEQTTFTLINPQNGNLAFKVFSFENNDCFDHIQRLNYYSIILLIEGDVKLKADFSEYDFANNTIMCFAPYQPFMISAKEKLKGMALNFHPDFFCIHKHHKEVSCNGVLFNNIYNPPFITVTEKELQQFILLAEQMKTEMQIELE